MPERISPDDEGHTHIAIAADVENNVVRIAFEKPMRWIAMEPAVAKAFANLILEKIEILQNADHNPNN